MFIFAFFIVLSLSQFVCNKLINISDESESSYVFNKRDSLIIGSIFIISIALQVFSSKFNKLYWIILGVYTVISTITLIIILQFRKQEIAKQREQIQQVYEILQKLVDKKNQGLDFDNIPFSLGYKHGNIQKIKVAVEPTQFTSDPSKTVMSFIPQLNAFLPEYNWNYDLHLEERYIMFYGNDKPPTMARWPGSWLRHFRFMPLGLSGEGEIAYQPDSIPKNEYGRSLYYNEHGEPVDTDKSLPTQPQVLCCGAPLGLNTVIPTIKGYKTIETIEVGDEVFDFYNKPVKVLGKSKVKLNPEKVYKLAFDSKTESNTTISVVSDSIHRFPKVVGYEMWYMATADELMINDEIFANNKKSYVLVKKEEIEKQPVQCILVNSNEHLFLITDKEHIHNKWKGGNSYPYEAVYTRNTGGGKAIWIEQEIDNG